MSNTRFSANYWKLLSATTAANFGDGLMALAIPWIASAITRDPLQIALVAMASRLPWLLFSLPAGVLADRLDRRRLVAWMDAARTVAIGAFAFVVLANQGNLVAPDAPVDTAVEPANQALLLGLLYLTAILIGAAEVVRDNTAQTLLPSIVPSGQLEKANGRMWAVETVANHFIGPPLAGILLALAFSLPLFLNAGMFAVAAALVFAITGTFAPQGGNQGRISWRAEIGEGIRWLREHRLLLWLAQILGAITAMTAAAMASYVLYVQEVLGLDARAFGLLTTGTAVGAVLGSLVADRVSRRLGPGASLMVSVGGLGASLAVLGLVSSGVIAWVMLASSAFLTVLWNIITVSLRQAVIPDHVLGRVNSVYRFIGWGTIPLGSLFGGALVAVGEPVLGREWALRAPFLVAAAVFAVLLAYARPRINTARIEQARAEVAPREPSGTNPA